MDDHINILESNQDEEITGGTSKLDQELESITGEMEEAREENWKLKALFPKDYQPMQMHFFDILQQDKQEEAAKATGTSHEESGLVSLSLGISSKGPSPTMDEKRSSNRNAKMREENLDNEGLALGLDIRFEPSSSSAQAEASPKRSFAGQGKEKELFEMCSPSKVLNKATTGESDTSQLKKPRVSIRARCDTQTMNDGCQWRKYGQKKAKGSLCPRSYYRCTVSPSCPVKKQVQRCSEDMSILITTYEGTHNHPLPSSATAIASITSAAASMLQSSSLISQQRLANSDPLPIINPSVAYNHNALNFTSSCQQFSRTQQLYFPYSSSISTSNSHPTITLDLTAPPTSSIFGKFFPSFSSMSSTNLSFSSAFSPLQSSVIDSSAWINPHSGYFNYEGSIIQNRNQNGSLMNTVKQPFQGHLYQPYYMGNHTISQLPLPDSIASAAAKAITANPKFQSAVALTALTTYVGDDYGAVGGGVRENHVGAESAALNLKLGGDMPYTKNIVYSSSQNGIGCGSSKSLNLSSSSLDAQQGNITFPLPQPPKSSYGSPFKKSNQLLLPRK